MTKLSDYTVKKQHLLDAAFYMCFDTLRESIDKSIKGEYCTQAELFELVGTYVDDASKANLSSIYQRGLELQEMRDTPKLIKITMDEIRQRFERLESLIDIEISKYKND